MSFEQNEQVPEVESLEAPNAENRFSTKAVLIGIGSIVGLAVVGFLVSSFSKRPAKAGVQGKAAVKKNLAKITGEVLKQPLEQAPNSKSSIKTLTGRIARLKLFFSAHKRVFIMASVITALAIAGVAYYLANKWQLEEEVIKKSEKVNELEAAIEDKLSEISDLKENLENERSEVSNLKANLENERSEVRNLKANLEKERIVVSNLKANLEKERLEVSNLKTNLEKERTLVSNLKASLEKERLEVSNLREELFRQLH